MMITHAEFGYVMASNVLRHLMHIIFNFSFYLNHFVRFFFCKLKKFAQPLKIDSSFLADGLPTLLKIFLF